MPQRKLTFAIPAPGCRLIVNGDDLGLSPEVNEGILKAFTQGILTSASLIPTGKAFEQAVQLIQDHPALDIGIHLTLTGEQSVLDRNDIPTLVDENGKFRPNAYRFFVDYARNRISMTHVRRELCAQFERLVGRGITITHVDSHQHIHMLPKILDISIQLANQFGVRFIRYPREKIRIQSIASFRKYPRLVQQIVLNLICFASRKKIRRYAIDRFFGFYHGGNLDRKNLKEIILDQPDEGISELMCHPAAPGTGQCAEEYSHWKYHWTSELEGLVDPGICRLIREREITLSSFRVLSGNGCP